MIYFYLWLGVGIFVTVYTFILWIVAQMRVDLELPLATMKMPQIYRPYVSFIIEKVKDIENDYLNTHRMKAFWVKDCTFVPGYSSE